MPIVRHLWRFGVWLSLLSAICFTFTESSNLIFCVLSVFLFSILSQSTEYTENHHALVWAYKQAFEAAAGVSYLHDGPFQSVMIQRLHQMARRQRRIGPSDFGAFTSRTVLAMLKHRWIFEGFNTEEIWKAVLSSFATKPKSKKFGGNSKPRATLEITEFAVLFQIIGELTKMGHFLYPFYCVEFSEEMTRKLARDQVVMIRKGAGIRDSDVLQSQRQFLGKLGIENDGKEDDQLRNGDLQVIADILHLTYSEEQRFQILSKLWRNTSEFRKGINGALRLSTHNEIGQWEEGINQLIAGYL